MLFISSLSYRLIHLFGVSLNKFLSVILGVQWWKKYAFTYRGTLIFYTSKSVHKSWGVYSICNKTKTKKSCVKCYLAPEGAV